MATEAFQIRAPSQCRCSPASSARPAAPPGPPAAGRPRRPGCGCSRRRWRWSAPRSGRSDPGPGGGHLQHPARPGHGVELDARQHRGGRGLVPEDVVVLVGQDLGPGRGGQAQADLVAHRPRGDVQGRLVAEALGHRRLQPLDGRVLAPDVVADLGLGHGPAHGRGGPGEGVGAESRSSPPVYARACDNRPSASTRDPHRGAMASTPLPPHDTLEIRGHIIDSMLFTRILDQVLEAHGSYEIERFDVGRTPVDASYGAPQDLHRRPGAAGGAGPVAHGPRHAAAGDRRRDPGPGRDGRGLPDGFYSSTNLETEVRVAGPGPGRQPGDGLRHRGPRPPGPHRAHVRRAQGRAGGGGQPGHPGPALDRGRSGEVFEFMSSQVSSEKPQGLIVRRVAGAMRATRSAARRSCGSAARRWSTPAPARRWSG